MHSARGSIARLYSRHDMGSPCLTPLAMLIGVGITPFPLRLSRCMYMDFNRFMKTCGKPYFSRVFHRYHVQFCHRLFLGLVILYNVYFKVYRSLLHLAGSCGVYSPRPG